MYLSLFAINSLLRATTSKNSKLNLHYTRDIAVRHHSDVFRSCYAQAQSRGEETQNPGTRYMPRRNTASVMKIWIDFFCYILKKLYDETVGIVTSYELFILIFVFIALSYVIGLCVCCDR